MKAFEHRVKNLEKGMGHLPKPGGRTSREQLTAERYVALLLKHRPIPKTLQKQVARLPPEELTPSMLRQIEWEKEFYEKDQADAQAEKERRK